MTDIGEIKQYVKAHWLNTFESFNFLIDGFEVSANAAFDKSNRLARTIYVNGYFKGVFICKDENNKYPEEGRRFYQTRYTSVYSAKRKREIIKLYGKREAKKRFSIDAKIDYKMPGWYSANAMIDHFFKENKSVKLIVK